jgi:hypothetical protein
VEKIIELQTIKLLFSKRLKERKREIKIMRWMKVKKKRADKDEIIHKPIDLKQNSSTKIYSTYLDAVQGIFCHCSEVSVHQCSIF